MIGVIIITFICFLSLIIGLIAYFRGFTKTADDYFVAGSSLGYFVLIFSLLASFLSAFSQFGMSSLGYRTGFGSLYVLTVNLVPLGFLWYLVHKKTFLLGRYRGWMSMGAPFGERYGKPMQIIIALVVFLASIPYIVAQIQGIGLMLEAMSKGAISYKAGVFFIPIFIAVYLVIGGMKGTAWINTVQGVFFSIMVVLLFFAVMQKNGGFISTMDMVYKEHPHLFQLGLKGGKIWGYSMTLGFATAMCLGCVCFPQPYMHAYSSRTASGLKAMFLSFGGLCLVIITMPTLVGIAARIIVPGLKGVQADKVYGLVAKAVFPEWLAALVVAGGFTAAISTVNGMVFGNAMNIANDIFRLFNPDMSDRFKITVGRLSVALILIISIIIAWNPKTPVAELSVIAFGTVSITLFPLIGAYFWKRATAIGAISSTLVGAFLNLLFILKGGKKLVLFPQPYFFNLNGFLFAFIISGIIFFLVSILTKPGKSEKDSLSLFFHPSLK